MSFHIKLNIPLIIIKQRSLSGVCPCVFSAEAPVVLVVLGKVWQDFSQSFVLNLALTFLCFHETYLRTDFVHCGRSMQTSEASFECFHVPQLRICFRIYQQIVAMRFCLIGSLLHLSRPKITSFWFVYQSVHYISYNEVSSHP